jgi:hypothetical protein
LYNFLHLVGFDVMLGCTTGGSFREKIALFFFEEKSNVPCMLSGSWREGDGVRGEE